MIQRYTENKYQRCRNKIGIQHSAETYSARQYGDDFGIVCHFGREKYNRDKHKQRAECVYVEWNNRQIKIEYDFSQRGFFGNKVINMLAYVENNDNNDYKRQHQQICPYKLAYYI
jgi:hypothetical protein